MTLRMRMVTSTLLLVLTVGIGIATNIVTDTFTWAWASALATLLLGAVAVQITASRLEGRATAATESAAPIKTAADAGSTAQQAVAVSGSSHVYTAGRDMVVGVSGRSLSIMAASMAAVALVVFGFAVIVTRANTPAGDSADRSNSTGSSDQALTGPDPYMYVGFDNSRHVARKQTCAGLFGLCLGQPVQLALDSFGTTEIDGYPQGGGPGETCHRWHPKRLDTVTVCESSGAIRSVRYDSLSSTSLVLAGPEDLLIRFPSTLPTEAESITAAFRSEPFSSHYVMGEGESIFSMDWFLPQEAEGTPDTHLFMVARDPDFPKEGIRPCAGADEIYFPYQEVVKHSQATTVSSVEVAMTRPEDLEGPEVCR